MTLDLASIVDFIMEYWDELALLIYSLVQFILSFKLLKKVPLDPDMEIYEALEDRRETTVVNIYSFITDILVYVPTLILLVAILFFNTSWRLLSGYVIGAFLVSMVRTIIYEDKSEDTKKALAKGLFAVFVALSLIF